MADNRQTAIADFKRIMKWIGAVAVLTVAAALSYLRLFGPLDADTAIATSLGVFFSILVGCGLFAAAFFSDKSGLDQQVTDVTRSERKRARRNTPITITKARKSS
jgi:hypothetical protein